MDVKYGFQANEIVEKGNVKWEDIEEIKAWTNKEQNLKLIPKLTDEQIVSFLLSCDSNIENTKTTITAFYSARKDGASLFNNRDIDNNLELKTQLKSVDFCVFPVRTDDNCAIIFHKLYDTSYLAYFMESSMKLLFMTLDAAIYDSPPKGLVIIFDMKGVGVMHLSRVKLYCLRTFFHYLQDGLPVKLSQVHVFNSTIVDKIMLVMKPFIKKQLLELIHFHSSSMNWEEFYSNCLPKKCLPIDYGGTLPSVKELHQQNKKRLRNLKDFFTAEENQRKQIHK